MNYRSRTFVLVSLLALAAGCGTSVISGGPGGAGGGGSTTTNWTTDSGWFSTTTVWTTDSGWTTTTNVGGAPPSSQPPGPGPTNPPDGTGAAVFALRRLYLGDTRPDGTPDAFNGWKYYGYDLDGIDASSSPWGVGLACKPLNNALPKTTGDAPGGIDNAFGRNLLPIFLGLSSDFAAKTNDSLATGGPNLLLDLEKLGAGSDYNPLQARVYQGAALGHTPAWNGSDAWPVSPESLWSAVDITSAKLTIAASYVINGTWVAKLHGELVIPTRALGTGAVATLDIPVRDPVITMDLLPNHEGATRGTIAGVVPLASFLTVITNLAATFDPSFCPGGGSVTLQSILANVSQSADILADGSQDPTKPCDGISLGIGFDATRVQLGSIAPPTPPLPDPCP